MAITRFTPRRGRTLSPWRELEEMSDRLTRMFDESVSGRGQNGGTWFPAVNVEETSDELVLTAELPGMAEDDIELELENNILTISGEKKEEREEGDERRYHLW